MKQNRLFDCCATWDQVFPRNKKKKLKSGHDHDQWYSHGFRFKSPLLSVYLSLSMLASAGKKGLIQVNTVKHYSLFSG